MERFLDRDFLDARPVVVAIARVGALAEFAFAEQGQVFPAHGLPLVGVGGAEDGDDGDIGGGGQVGGAAFVGKEEITRSAFTPFSASSLKLGKLYRSG